MGEFVTVAGLIAQSLSIPVICDADQAGETSLNAYRTVKSFERAGVAAIHIEDTVNPKHASGSGRRPAGTGFDRLQPIPEMVSRLAAALDARTDPDFVIIGRTEALLYGMPIDEAIRRGVAYAKAGIDLFWANGGGSADAINRLAKEVPVPILAINAPLRLVKDTPLKVDMFTTSSMGWAAKLHDTMVRQLKEHGEYTTRPESMDITNLLNTSAYSKMAEHWLGLKKG
jgi:2-methylisocitrate lyase-like PEP mutase family enzyme